MSESITSHPSPRPLPRGPRPLASIFTPMRPPRAHSAPGRRRPDGARARPCSVEGPRARRGGRVLTWRPPPARRPTSAPPPAPSPIRDASSKRRGRARQSHTTRWRTGGRGASGGWRAEWWRLLPL
eukprot:scaffold705_cov402-Prasinococcus_capsulatus_cf.AAC.37